MRLLALTLAVALSIAAPVWALDPLTPLSQYVRTTWTEREGLTSGLIWTITQDRDGYLWLGTDAGLIRFDGVRFVHIDEARLKTARIGALLSASDGSLWIGSNSTVLSRLKGTEYTHYSGSDALPLGVTALLEDHTGVLWAGGRGGLSRFSNGGWERMRGIAAESGDPDEGLTVTGLFEDREHAIWASTLRGLYRRRDGGQIFERIRSVFQVRALTEDKAGALWAVGPDRAIGMALEARNDEALQAWRDVNGWRVLPDHDGNVWVATLGRGVLRLTTGSRSNIAITRLGTDAGLSHDVVRSLFEDREGNLWVGTQHGLNRFSESTVRMLTSSSDLSQPVRAVTAGPDGSVWAGTDNGVYRFDGTTSTHFGRAEGLPALAVGALYTDKKGTTWVALDHGGLAKFENGRFVVVKGLQTRIQRVWAMTGDDDGALWLCEVDAGLFRWKEGALSSFVPIPEASPRSCGAATTDHLGRVWIGFPDGKVVVREEKVIHVYDESDGLPGGIVHAIYEDSRGRIWVGGANGLATFADGRFSPVTSPNGDAHTNVRAIVEDSSHNVWIGDSAGLGRLDEGTRGGPSVGLFDGLRGVPMSVGGSPTAARGADGRLWIVTSSGLAIVDAAKTDRNRVPPPVLIESVLADDRPFSVHQPVALPPRTSRIQFDYTGLSFTAPEKVQFRYRLEGFDSQWIDAGTRRQAFYTNLPPRDYRFRVLAGNDGAWSEAGASLDFSIQPTFFQTPAFSGLVGLAGALLIFGAWKIRARQVHQRFALILGERARVAREIHDTLLQSLVGVAFQFDAASSELDDSPPVAKARLTRLRDQIASAIKEARQSIWDLRSPALEGRELATALRDVGETITGRTVRFDLAISGVPRRDMPRLDEALLRIGREAISNAVRHGSATEVRVQLSYEPEAVTLRVIDNGRGFESEPVQVADHWGLATMRERAEQLGGRLRLASSPGRGTEVEFIAPFGKTQRA